MRTWLSQLFTPARPARRGDRFRTQPSLQRLENRDAPAITVGTVTNITKSAGDDQETMIIVNPANPLNMFSANTSPFVNKFSTDGGKTWQDSDLNGVLGGGGLGDQQADWDEFGNLFLTYFAGNNGNTVVAFSVDGGATFQLSLDTGSLFDQPEIAAAKGFVVVDYTNGGGREVQYAKVTGKGQIGAWSGGLPVSNSGTFGDIDIGANGQVMIVYQENNGGDAPANMFADLDPDGPGPAGFSAVTLPQTITNVGSFDFITPQPNRSVDSEMNLAWDRTGGANNNRVYLVYTDELPDESNDTDIFLIFSDNNGTTWSAKKRLNDDPVGNGKAQFLPAIAIDQKSGAVAVTWYDSRNSASNTTAQVFATVSRDGGATWEPNVIIGKGVSDVTSVGGGFDHGDYDQMSFVNGNFYRSWSDNSNSTGDNPDGTNGLDMYFVECKAGGLPPVVTGLSVDPNPISIGQTVTLTGSFTDPDSPTDAFRVVITWGDGTNDTTLNLQPGRKTFSTPHVYFGGGSITTNVTVFDADGNKGTGKITVTTENDPPEAVITGVPTAPVDEGKKVSLGSFVKDTNPFDSFSYNWTVFKNGNFYDSGSNAGVSFVPDDNGVYDVFLSVSDSSGGSTTADPVQIIAKNVAPKADGLFNNGPKATNTLVRLTVQNPTDAAADVAAGLQYQFDTNGDGVYDTAWLANPFLDVQFAAEGFYTLKAHIRDKDLGISADYFTDVLISNTGGGNGGVITTRYVVAGSDASPPAVNGEVPATSTIKVFNLDGTLKFATLRPFGQNYTGGYRVATGDVNGDHVEDIIAGPGRNGGSTIVVLDGTTGNQIFALPNVYGTAFKSGVYLASGDFNRDGYADIVVSPGAAVLQLNGLPAPGQIQPVKGFSGFTQGQMFSFSPFGSSKTGTTVAVGDVDGDRRPDLIAGNETSGSQVKVFRFLAGGLSTAAYRTFTALPSTFTRGVFVAAGDLDGDRKAEVIIGSNVSPGYDSRVRVFTNGATTMSMTREFVPFAGNRIGVRVAADDLDGDGKADIIVAPAKPVLTSGPNPRILGLNGLSLAGKFQQEVTDDAFQGGVFVG